MIEREFKGFRHLFTRFLLDPKSIDGVHWEKIEKLPDGAVSFSFFFSNEVEHFFRYINSNAV